MDKWRVSLHGGHCGDYCDHAEGPLRPLLEAAVAFGYQIFGVTEHAPRAGKQFLYDEEVEMGWTVDTLYEKFAAYEREINTLVHEFADRLTVLRGFEAEVVPADQYGELMQAHFDAGRFDYVVGSVHYVDNAHIEGSIANFEKALSTFAGLEKLVIRYYGAMSEMIETLHPQVIGHFDVIRKLAGPYGSVDTPSALAAAVDALDVAKQYGCILDCNTAGYRKGLGTPYPAPPIVELARDRGVPFCFGDDSHRPSEVGAGIDHARQYLLGLGVSSITVLDRDNDRVVQRVVSLDT